MLETVKVCSNSQLARVMYVIVNAPEFFNGGEGVNGSDGAAPSCLLGLSGGVIEPEGPRVLKRVGVTGEGAGGGGWPGGGGGVVVVEDLSLLKVFVFVVRVCGDLVVSDA